MIGFNELAGVGVVAFVAGTAVDLAGEAFTPPTRIMALESLRYENGQFIQKHSVEGGPIRATWSASVKRNGRVLCSGGGSAPYDGHAPADFTPSEWTRDNCPDLQSGDVGLAVWEYRLKNGTLVSVSGRVVIEGAL